MTHSSDIVIRPSEAASDYRVASRVAAIGHSRAGGASSSQRVIDRDALSCRAHFAPPPAIDHAPHSSSAVAPRGSASIICGSSGSRWLSLPPLASISLLFIAPRSVVPRLTTQRDVPMFRKWSAESRSYKLIGTKPCVEWDTRKKWFRMFKMHEK